MAKKQIEHAAPEVGALYRTRANTGINLQLECEYIDETDPPVVHLAGQYFRFDAPVDQFHHFFEKST